MQGGAQPPSGYVYNPQYGDYEDPKTGNWWNPADGQVYSASSGGSNSSPSYGGPASTTGGTLGSAYLAHQLLSQGGSAAASSAAPAASAAASGSSGVTGSIGATGSGAFDGVTASGTAVGGSGAPAASGFSLAGAAPYAGPAIAAVGTGVGISHGLKDWNHGHGAQQEGGTKIINSIASPTLGFANLLPESSGNTIQNVGGALMGNPLALASLAGVNFWSGKDKDQVQRDGIRGQLKDAGVLPSDTNNVYHLPDGTDYDFGKDGNARLTNAGTNIDGQSTRHTYDVDFSDPRAADDTSVLNFFGAVQGKGDQKRMSDTTGMLENVAHAGGNAHDNIMHFFDSAGLDHDSAYAMVHNAAKAQGGYLDDGTADALKNSLDQFYGVGAYSGGKTPSSKPASSPKPVPRDPPMQSGTSAPAAQTMYPKAVAGMIPRVTSPMPSAAAAPIRGMQATTIKTPIYSIPRR